MIGATGTVGTLAVPLRAAVLARQGKLEAHSEGHAHGDANPSARFNPEKLAWCCDVCGAGGGARDLAERLGIEVSEPGNGKGRPPGVPAVWDGKHFTGAWCYRDTTGRELGWTARYDGSEGKKDVIPFFQCAGRLALHRNPGPCSGRTFSRHNRRPSFW